MTSIGGKAVVVLHGLQATIDPYEDLYALESDLNRVGYQSLRFDWPSGFNPVLALGSRSRTCAGELAQKLDEFLRERIATTFSDGRWVILAHSLGGATFYQWLVDYGHRFYQDFHTFPSHAFVFAAPFRCTKQQTELPNGAVISTHEPPGNPDLIAHSLPGRLYVFLSPSDRTAPPEDTEFSNLPIHQGIVTQIEITGADHRNICGHVRSRAYVQYFLNHPTS